MVDPDSQQASKVAEDQIPVRGPVKPVNRLSLCKQRVHLVGLATRSWNHIQVLRSLGLDSGQSLPITRQGQCRVTIRVASDGLELISSLRDESDLRSPVVVRSSLRI